MRIEYIGHACLLLDTGDVKLTTDPWFNGPAYCGQWNIFPKPVGLDRVKQADVVLLSHGHEDHLHTPSLDQLPKNKSVFYPYYWYGGTKEFLKNDLGFRHVMELGTFKTYPVTERTSITYVTNSLDSIMVIESGGRVIVNVNDALHSSATDVIDDFVEVINKKWPRIDTVFCGFGGASYFPNCFHLPGKDDVEIGRLREQVFVHNFCRIVKGLNPQVAVSFAADFALLSPHQRWINNVRFSRAQIPAYFDRRFGGRGGTRIVVMYPGDVLTDDKFQQFSPYPERLRSSGVNGLIDQQYAVEINALKNIQWEDEVLAVELFNSLQRNVIARASSFNQSTLNKIEFSIRISDVLERNYYNVAFTQGRPRVWRAEAPASGAILRVETNSKLLRYSLDSDWGGEGLAIGYGCDIHIFNRETVEQKLDKACVKLIHRIPTFKDNLQSHTARSLKTLINDPMLRQRATEFFARSKSGAPDMLDKEIWLLKSAGEIRQMFGLPVCDEDERLITLAAAQGASQGTLPQAPVAAE
jgi:hypothetical protein